jgi:fused signal recognition particle receptor
MFGKLKNKLKEWTKKISEVEETEEKITKEQSVTKGKKVTKKTSLKKPIKEKLSEKIIDEIIKKEVSKPKYQEPIKKFNAGIQDYEPDLEKLKKKSFLKKITSKTKTISEKEFINYSEDLEMILLENNVALEVAEKIINELKDKIVGEELNKKEIIELITKSLKEIIEKVLIEPFNILEEIKNKKDPYVLLFCGINGTGKTTHIAKIAKMLKEKKLTPILAAADTFRAAAVEQLKKHGENLNIKVISHDYGSDPASVGFDAIKYAEKNKIDVVLIDTAGRIHTATNLIREMIKIKKVCKPDRTIFVGESITGNDATDQVKAFNNNIGIDGIILSKADIDEKGGTALSVGYTTNKPILYLGIGQGYGDLEKFDKKKFIEKLGL